MKQEMKKYSEEDKKVWKILFSRQVNNLQDKSCNEYLQALDEMNEVLNSDEIPNFESINDWFQKDGRTGWKIEVVPGLIPVDDFFELLAQKKFCSSTWLRSLSQLDYLEEPDMFHDVFGHIPLLSNPRFSEFMQKFGKMGVEAKGDHERIIQLQRLYWFTIEFGLIGINEPKIYGAGICSSFGETNRSIDHQTKKEKFDIQNVITKSFTTDSIQESYVCIESFEELIQALDNL
jgi:phenylalanine-4-hydroxylase